MLSIYSAIGYGAVGGLIVEALSTWTRLLAWQDARHSALAAHKSVPPFGQYVDPIPDLLVAATRAALGCGAGWLLRDEMTGVYTAVAVGASAPALLAQLGRAKGRSGALEKPQSDADTHNASLSTESGLTKRTGLSE
jgi:hypothetical protein